MCPGVWKQWAEPANEKQQEAWDDRVMCSHWCLSGKETPVSAPGCYLDSLGTLLLQDQRGDFLERHEIRGEQIYSNCIYTADGDFLISPFIL